MKVTLTLEGSADFSLAFDPTPVEAWGLNFVGVVRVTRDGAERLIYIPGTRTYDPAGISGDPHASERIGPSCSRTQIAITLAELVAALHGGGVAELGQLQENLLPLIARYHGRQTLFQWMFVQIKDAIFEMKYVRRLLYCTLTHQLITLYSSMEHTYCLMLNNISACND